MNLLSFSIETKLSADDVIDLVRGVRNTSSLSNTERKDIIRAFPASHWPMPNILSTHPDYGSLIAFSRRNRTLYLGRIIPSDSGSGTVIIFGVDQAILAIVAFIGLSLFAMGISRIPGVSVVFALSVTLLFMAMLYLGMLYKLKQYRRLINKMISFDKIG